MALDSNNSLIAAAREDVGPDEPRPGSLFGPQTAKQRDDYKASIERERDEYQHAGNAAGVQACATELQRLESEPVAEPSLAPPTEGRRLPPSEAPGSVAREGGLFSAPSPPRKQTDDELARYIESVEREHDQYEREGNIAGMSACDSEVAAARAKLTTN